MDLQKLADGKSAVKIDRHDLEGEWLQQASLYHEFAVAHAEAYRQVEVLKREIDLLRAEADEQTRFDLENAGEKITEAKVARMVGYSPKVVSKSAELIDVQFQMANIAAVRDALGHKKTALEFLSRLQLSDWNSEPRGMQADKDADEKRVRSAHLAKLNEPGAVGKKAPSRIPRRME